MGTFTPWPFRQIDKIRSMPKTNSVSHISRTALVGSMYNYYVSRLPATARRRLWKYNDTKKYLLASVKMVGHLGNEVKRSSTCERWHNSTSPIKMTYLKIPLYLHKRAHRTENTKRLCSRKIFLSPYHFTGAFNCPQKRGSSLIATSDLWIPFRHRISHLIYQALDS